MVGSTKSPIEEGRIALALDSNAPVSGSAGSAKVAMQKGQATRRTLWFRRHLKIAVHVYGHGSDKEPFFEETNTLTVHAHGAVITLVTMVNQDQKLILTNPKTGEDLECKVAYLEPNENGETNVGIEFMSPPHSFWGIAFPPDDWNPDERKRPRARPAGGSSPEYHSRDKSEISAT